MMPQWEYGDPLKVAARREAIAQRQARACGRCIHRISIEWKGQAYHSCEHQRRRYGVRCELYREKVKRLDQQTDLGIAEAHRRNTHEIT